MSRVSSITRLVQETIFASPTEAREIARAIGKPYSTLMREVNPWDPGAKLGADTLLQVMQVTRDVRPLEYMADELGYTICPK